MKKIIILIIMGTIFRFGYSYGESYEEYQYINSYSKELNGYNKYQMFFFNNLRYYSQFLSEEENKKMLKWYKKLSGYDLTSGIDFGEKIDFLEAQLEGIRTGDILELDLSKENEKKWINDETVRRKEKANKEKIRKEQERVRLIEERRKRAEERKNKERIEKQERELKIKAEKERMQEEQRLMAEVNEFGIKAIKELLKTLREEEGALTKNKALDIAKKADDARNLLSNKGIKFEANDEYTKLKKELDYEVERIFNENLNKLKNEGYSDTIARYYVENEINPKDVKHTKYKKLTYWMTDIVINSNLGNGNVDAYVKRFAKINKIDPRRVYKLRWDEMRNPYADKGKIIEINPGKYIQIFDRKTALFERDGQMYYIEFETDVLEGMSMEFVVLGAYKYTSVIGAGVSAYHLQQVKY